MNKTEELLVEQYNILLEEKERLQVEVSLLPVGSIQEKRIKDRLYSYRQYREGKSVKTVFIPDNQVSIVSEQIERRKSATHRIKEIDTELKQLSKALGGVVHSLGIYADYKPVKNVDYEDYTHYMSYLAHELKRLGKKNFIKEYSSAKKTGINGRYLKGLLNYLSGNKDEKYRNSTYLVLDPFTYQMYYLYKDKDILKESIKEAIPEFLQQGILVTNIQEAVNGALS